MPAYVIVELSVTDAQEYERYKELAQATVAAHGGAYVVRGGTTVTVEGEPMEDRLVVLRFPDLPAARAWYESPEYREASAIRKAAATTKRVLFVEGYDPPAPEG